MKKDKLFIVLLLVSIGCITNTSVTIAASAQSENKNAASSHKKNKPARSTSTGHQRRMSEKDIAECTQLIDKVARTDKLLQSAMITPAATSQLKKPATTQIFTSDNPAAIAHLTGAAVNLAPALANSAPPNHNLATSTAPVPLKQVAKSTIPAGTQIFASDDPQKIAHLTGKITSPLTGSAPQVVAKKSVARPRIHLFAPNTPDLDTLEGKSANLASLQKTAPVDTVSKAKATAKPKAKKAVHKSAKSAPATDANKKTEQPAPKSEKSAPATDANKKTEQPAPKSEKKPDPAAVSSEKPKNSI